MPLLDLYFIRGELPPAATPHPPSTYTSRGSNHSAGTPLALPVLYTAAIILLHLHLLANGMPSLYVASTSLYSRKHPTRI